MANFFQDALALCYHSTRESSPSNGYLNHSLVATTLIKHHPVATAAGSTMNSTSVDIPQPNSFWSTANKGDAFHKPAR